MERRITRRTEPVKGSSVTLDGNMPPESKMLFGGFFAVQGAMCRVHALCTLYTVLHVRFLVPRNDKSTSFIIILSKAKNLKAASFSFTFRFS